jgi:hypothetical protein
LKVVLVGDAVEAVLLYETQRLLDALGRARDTQDVVTAMVVGVVSDINCGGIHPPGIRKPRADLGVWLDQLPGRTCLAKQLGKRCGVNAA